VPNIAGRDFATWLTQKIIRKLGSHTDAALPAYAIRHGIASAESRLFEQRRLDEALANGPQNARY
jgi:hypothetical protein